ncbi:MAG TPA: FAD-dependent oxidoreductase [Vitreimonas sp.]|uniref:FAD-dependent oxidoreductase n=1 Tax=Vitreimonas sp. TaxID=3069702 RepID=UPI002D43928F|nr:FAD-dependent oxidoreductase [Vitreimonas sp.]HYD87793.1 FAD-dependent oxidoreductase [Vitreimonas sp.]
MSKRIAILGAGIMGSCLALFLARRGCVVTVFDEAAAPLMGASRWNEGKIHLGYLYAADPSLETARRVLPGGLAFAPLMRELIDGELEHITADDDLYLVHRNSVASPDAIRAYFENVSTLVREAPGAGAYLADASRASVRALSAGEFAAIADPREIVAAYAAPERSIATAPLADKLAGALATEPRIRLRLKTRIEPSDLVEDADGWRVRGERFDYVVNALWHGRIAIDAALGIAPPPGWSHRYRVSAFIRTARPVKTPSAVVAIGPFGDVKNYNDRDFYVSWYPAGLIAESETLAAPAPPRFETADKKRIAAQIENGLGVTYPAARAIFANAESIAVEGGYVFAQGKGSLADPSATLHQRSQFGVRRRGRYISIDTGKYSTAPLMARQLAAEIS